MAPCLKSDFLLIEITLVEIGLSLQRNCFITVLKRQILFTQKSKESRSLKKKIEFG